MSLRQSIEPFQRISEPETGFFTTWREELLSFWREFRHRYVLDRSPSLTIEFEETRLSLELTSRGKAESLGKIECNGETPSHAIAVRLAHLCAQAGAARDIALELPASTVLRADLSMPRTSRCNLEQALRFELARLTPLDADQLYFDFTVAATERSAKTRPIHLRMLKRSVVDEAIRICREAGLHVATIRFGDDVREADFRQFPVNRIALLRTLWRRYSVLLLGTLGLALALTLVAASYARYVDAGENLADQLFREQRQAVLVEHLEAEARSAQSESQFLLDQKRAPMLVGILSDLSRTLPDNTWLTQVTVEGDKIRLQGYSRAASELIAAFDRSASFADAQFTAPLTQDARSNVERFDLAVRVLPHRP